MSFAPSFTGFVLCGVACWTVPFNVNIQWLTVPEAQPIKKDAQPEKKPVPQRRDLPLPPGMEIRRDIQEVGKDDRSDHALIVLS